MSRLLGNSAAQRVERIVALVSASHDCRFTILGGCDIDVLVAFAQHGFKDVTFCKNGGGPSLPHKADVVWAPEVRQDADLKTSAADAARVLKRGGTFIASFSGFGTHSWRAVRDTLTQAGFEAASVVGDFICAEKRTELQSGR